KVEAGANVVVFGLGGIGLNVIQGAKMVGADKIIGVDLNPRREAMARQFGMTHFLNPKDHANIVDSLVQLTDGGADYSFECIGNTTTMRKALDEALGDEGMVLPVYTAYRRIVAAQGETPDLDSLTDAERVLFEQWHEAETAAVAAAFGTHRYMGDAMYEILAA